MPEPARWTRLEALFAAAMEQPSGVRAAFVQAEAGDDAALAAEVLALVAHAAQAASDWGESAADYGEPLLADSDFTPGDRIGPYELDALIGRGGMGTVWRAHRTDGLRLRVALKVIRRGLDTTDVRDRFRQERDLLAALDHPGIARILDGGVTPDGRPYFAMELVEGEPLDRYCDRHRLSVEARLRLFQHVCEAVQYAHQRLVVHRDLKPSNVLVSGDGEAATVKLLDFGIAKVLQPGALGLSGLFTRAEQRPLTPAYAAPEQLAGAPVTTATDVYGLGALLYELLTGHVPVTTRRRLEVVEQVRPSEAVGQTATRVQPDGTTVEVSPEAVGNARRLPPERLRRLLTGDLDRVVLMALRPEPERRYTSAAALADDVARHLAGHTVRARPDTLGYRVRTFVRRHRAGVAAAVAFVVVLAGFAATMAVERGRTAREAAKARAVADVLSGLFAATNPTVANGDTLTVNAFLERSEGRLRHDLAGQPAVLEEVLGVIGMAYRDMMAFDRADGALGDALALARRRDPRGEATVNLLGERATLQFMRGDLGGALVSARERLTLLRQRYGPADLRLVPALSRIAAIHLQAHRLDSARAALDAGLALTRPHAQAHPEVHLQMVGLEAWYYAEMDEPEASVRVARELLALHRRTGASLADVALAERVLGNQCYFVGDLPCALGALNASLEHYRRVFGPDNRYVAIVLGNLAETHAAAVRDTLADRLFPAALAMKRRYFGPAEPEIGFTLMSYGRYAHARGRLAQADTLLAAADRLWAATREPTDRQRLATRAAHALVRYDLGDRAAADTVEAVWQRVRAAPRNRSWAALALTYSDLRRRQGRTAEADSVLRIATPVLRASPFRAAVE